MGKSKTTRTRPGYVPRKGWFFDIKEHAHDSKVWYNGQPVEHVSSLRIECTPGNATKAQLEIFAPAGRISCLPSQVGVQKRSPGSAPWGVTKEESPAIAPIEEKITKKARRHSYSIAGKVAATCDQVRSAIEEYTVLSGFHPYFDVTVSDNPILPGHLHITASVDIKTSQMMLDAGLPPQKTLEKFVETIVPVGVSMETSLTTVSVV